MPSLQLHQLRAAAVGKLICDNFKQPVNTKDVLLACLFHDMGNIIKSDLTYFSDFLKPEGYEYWQGIKNEYIKKYGLDSHEANSTIARKIGLPEGAYQLLAGLGFSKLEKILSEASNEQKVCEYADLRVGPYGILPLEERLNEGRARYVKTHTMRAHYDSDDAFRKLTDAAKKLEQQVLSLTSLTPERITDVVVKDIVEELRNYPLK